MHTSTSSNPWTRPAPAGWPVPIITTCDAVSRIDQVKASTDRPWLNRVVRDRDTQANVRQAAERRLRKLMTLIPA